jgi:hypothetical protein
MRRVCAEEGRNVARDKSAYINRTRERDLRQKTPVQCVSSYMRRQEELEEAQGEVLHSGVLLPPGVDISRDEIWNAVDRAARRKDGEYKRHAGHMPCLAIFADASLPWGLTADAAIGTTRAMGQWLVDTYGCGVETAIHIKDGKIDHAHFLFSDRVILKDGVGSKIRSMNGIADRTTEVEGGRRVSSFAEAARAEWARLTRLASGTRDIDHRSFQRQGRDDKPCPDIPRAKYEYEQRHGLTTSRDNRKAMLAARAAQQAKKERAARNHLAQSDRPFSFGRPPSPENPADKPPVTEGFMFGRLPQEKPATAEKPSEIRIPAPPQSFPDVDIQATVSLAGGFGVSTMELERLRRELCNCTDPYVHAELLRKLEAEEQHVKMQTVLAMKRREEAERQLSAQRRASDLYVDEVIPRLHSPPRPAPKVQFDSAALSRKPTAATSPGRTREVLAPPEIRSTVAPSGTRPATPSAESRQPDRPQTALAPAPPAVQESPVASRPVPTSSSRAAPDQKVTHQDPTKHSTTSDRAAPERVSNALQVSRDFAHEPAQQGPEAGSAPDLHTIRECTRIYAGALFRLQQLTRDNLQALAEIAGVSTQVLERGAKACYVPPGRTPQESIESIMSIARIEKVERLVQFHEARVQRAKPQATLARGPANNRGQDGRDR